MSVTGRDKPSAPSSGAERPAEKSRLDPPLPLGGGAFASPLLVSSRPESASRKHYRQTAIALVSAALLASGIVGMALFLRGQQAERTAQARLELRAEPPSEMRKQPAPPRTVQPKLGALAPTPSASTARPLSAAASAKPSPAVVTEVVAALPTVQAIPVASSKPETTERVTRAERKQRASKPEPALPEALTRAQVIAAMRKVTPAVNTCFGSTHGKAQVTFSVVGKTGRVVGAQVTGKAGKVGSCIARTVRRARFPKFAKSRIEITYPFAR